MITCSMPAATASSTAYWITGLSTSGSISFGWALVAGRKRVPQPAAGKTALRTRMEPRSGRVESVGRGYHRGPAPRRAARRRSVRGRPTTRRGEPPDRGREAPPAGRGSSRCVARRIRTRRGSAAAAANDRSRRPEEEVELAVDQEGRAGIGGEARLEPLADERPDGDRAAGEREPAGEDRLGDRGRVAPAEEPAG